MSVTTKSLRPLVAAVLVVLTSGCTVGPDYGHQPPPAETAYTRTDPNPTEADTDRQRFYPDSEVSANWWEMFRSQNLSRAVDIAFSNNPSIEAAQASLRESEHDLQAGYGVFYPQLDGSISATRQLPSAYRFGTANQAGIFNLFTVGAAISYTLDVFGGQRRTVEALGAQVDYQRYVALATYLSLSGNVVNTAIARAAYNAQYEATQQLILRQKEQVAIAENQAGNGIAPYASVLSLRSVLAGSQAALAALAQKRDQADHLLANLQGATASGAYISSFDLAELALPNDLPLSLPSELVRQRPDILAAEAQLHVASANVGIATAALLPSFSIGANYGLSNTSIGNLGDKSSKFWSAGPAVDIPLFHGGASWYKRRAAEDAYARTLAAYRQTVLSAFAQVADVLTAIEHDARAMQAQADTLAAAQEALNLVDANYRAGLVSYLNVLAADTQYYQSKIAYLQATAQRYQDTTALFVALGGGWWNAPPRFSDGPSAHQAGGG